MLASRWSLDEGIAQQRAMEAALAPVGWHCALGGGVIRSGSSEHDLDIIAFPAKRGRARPAENEIKVARAALTSIGMSLRLRRSSVRASWRERGFDDNKHVEIWLSADGRRVDLMVLS